MRSRSFPKFSNGEYRQRNLKLKELMEEASVSACVIFGSPGNVANLYYWTHYITRSPAFFGINSDGDSRLFIWTFNHISTAKEMSVISEIEWIGPSPVETIVETVKKLIGDSNKISGKKKKNLGLIGNLFPHDFVRAFESRLEVKTVNLTKKANQIRAIKSEEEIGWLRKGAALTDRAMKALESEIKIGMTEYQIANIVESSYVPLGGTTRIHYFGSTAMRDPEIYVPAQYQSSRHLKRGDIVITELSAEYGGYAGQIHRPISVGIKPTETYSKLYDVSLDAYENVLSNLKDGSTSEELIKAADEAIVSKGYTVCDSLIHGFGTDLAFPELGTSNSVYSKPHYEFKENMAVVIQPNPITLNHKFGLQLGNLCLVGKKRSVSLQKFPMKFVVV
jgi:Xaa-Pro dipeptidase